MDSYDGTWYTENNGTAFPLMSQKLIELDELFIHHGDIRQTVWSKLVNCGRKQGETIQVYWIQHYKPLYHGYNSKDPSILHIYAPFPTIVRQGRAKTCNSRIFMISSLPRLWLFLVNSWREMLSCHRLRQLSSLKLHNSVPEFGLSVTSITSKWNEIQWDKI